MSICKPGSFWEHAACAKPTWHWKGFVKSLGFAAGATLTHLLGESRNLGTVALVRRVRRIHRMKFSPASLLGLSAECCWLLLTPVLVPAAVGARLFFPAGNHLPFATDFVRKGGHGGHEAAQLQNHDGDGQGKGGPVILPKQRTSLRTTSVDLMVRNPSLCTFGFYMSALA